MRICTTFTIEYQTMRFAWKGSRKAVSIEYRCYYVKGANRLLKVLISITDLISIACVVYT